MQSFFDLGKGIQPRGYVISFVSLSVSHLHLYYLSSLVSECHESHNPLLRLKKISGRLVGEMTSTVIIPKLARGPVSK